MRCIKEAALLCRETEDLNLKQDYSLGLGIASLVKHQKIKLNLLK